MNTETVALTLVVVALAVLYCRWLAGVYRRLLLSAHRSARAWRELAEALEMPAPRDAA